MLEIKSICEVEVLKEQYGIKDNLVKLNSNIINELSKYSYEMDYISLYLNSIENLDAEKIVAFFNNTLKNDIIKRKYWVSYLDTHMENRCIEDGERLEEDLEGIKESRDRKFDTYVFTELEKELQYASDSFNKVTREKQLHIGNTF